MENIDDLMRQKFDSDDPGERFEFREEYWEQAQALLEKEEGKRGRRFWLIIGLVLALALLTWLLLMQGSDGSLSEKKAGEKAPTVANEKPERPNYADGKDTLSGQTMQSSNAREQTNDGIRQGDENMSISPIPIAPTGSKIPERTRHGNTGNKSISNTDAGTTISLADAEISRQILAGKNDAVNTGGIDIARKETTKPDDNSPFTTPPFTNPPAEATAKEGPPITIPIFTIPTPLYPMPLPERIFQIQKRPTLAKEPIAAKIKPVKDKGFSFGLSVAGAAYQQSDTVGRWAAWTVGAFGDYQLNKSWSFMLGVQTRFVPGHMAQADSSNPNLVENLRYSFGYQSEEWRLETRGLHFLEVPISAHWHKGSWGLEAGGAAGMLLGVQNRTEHTTESSLETPKTTVKRFVKGNFKPYNQRYFSAFAGAEYRLNNRFSLMTRAQYRFTPVFKTLGEGLKNNGLGNVELGLRLRLF
ncbi:MAG: hypothetical protein ACKVU0_16600 [Saprospiraceae bacterium]